MAIKNLTIKEVAVELDVDKRTIFRYIKSGILIPTSETLGGRSLFSSRYIDEIKYKIEHGILLEKPEDPSMG